MPINNASIAGGKLNNNNSKYLLKETPKNPGDISRRPNHPEDKLIERSDKELRVVCLENSLIQ